MDSLTNVSTTSIINCSTAISFPQHCSDFRHKCQAVQFQRNHPEDWTVPLYGFIFPVFVVITLVTNTFIVVVMSKPHLRTPTNLVLVSMAVTEMFTGLVALPWFFYYYTLGSYKEQFQCMAGSEMQWISILPPIWCQLVQFLATILPTICHTAAMWLTVYLAIQRYVYVCLYTMAPRFCTLRKSALTVTIIVLSAFVAHLPSMAPYFYETLWVSGTEGQRLPVCLKVGRSWTNNTQRVKVVFSVRFWFESLCVHTIPCLLMAVFTGLLIRAIRAARERRKSLHHNLNISKQNSKDSSNKVKKGVNLNNTTKMLVVIILLVFLIEIPYAVIFALHVLLTSDVIELNSTEKYKLFYSIMKIAIILRNVAMMISFPLKFAIYCGMNQQFRLTVKQMFSREVLFVEQPIKHEEEAHSGSRRYSVLLLVVKNRNPHKSESAQSHFIRDNAEKPKPPTTINEETEYSRTRFSRDRDRLLDSCQVSVDNFTSGQNGNANSCSSPFALETNGILMDFKPHENHETFL